MEPPVGNKFRIGRKICGGSFGDIYLEIVIIRRGSCDGKGEEKGGGGTSGQGHSSEVETHDQESAARFRKRKQTYIPESFADATRNLSQQNLNF
ncbi:hypothetical protein HN51_069503 [Arachis hypogaea]|nr:uncharacterized protein DS421_15g501240 [Arachis hypogaea]